MAEQQPAASGNVYDQVPYPNMCFAQSHPDRLAMIGRLLGLKPTPIEQCRVLELGCASGGNLIPMAYTLPGSTFVGVDLSERQIADGQAVIETLELKNIELKQRNVMDFSAADGQFDYIIAHGLYSWVPPIVREKVLQICKQNMAPNGIAYISYNTLPGWHMLGIARDMMLYRTRHIADPMERIAEARSIAQFIAGATAAIEGNAFGAFMNSYNALMNKESDYIDNKLAASLLHDEMSEYNEPFYFYQFVEQAEQHGLQYLAEAEFWMVMPTNLPEAVREHVFEMANTMIDVEQYMDFLRNRTFRQTLLCHEDINVNRGLKIEPIFGFYASSRAKPANAQPDIHSAATEQFSAASGATFATDHPVTKAAMLHLAGVSPRRVAFDELLNIGRSQVYAKPDSATLVRDRQLLAANLLQAFCFSMSLVELHVYEPVTVRRAGEKPIASAYARSEVAREEKVTNLWHENTVLDDVSRRLLPYLDGTHDRAALIELLHGWVREGVIGVVEDDQPIQDEAAIRQRLGQDLETALQWLANIGLLVE